jgi:heat shock protein HslJ
MAAVATPTLDQAANATYKGLDVGPEITLANGRWEGRPAAEGGSSRATATLVRDFLLAGDVDGDGASEAVVLLATSSGGSGTFNHVAILSGRSGQVANVGTAALGDRVAVMRARLLDRKIELQVVQAGPEDARCCPSEKATRVFALDGDALAEVSATVTGQLSLADLGGVEWVLIGFDQTDPAPADPRISLIIQDDKIAGFAGCNRYMGAVTAGGSPGDLQVQKDLASTRRACPEPVMLLEQRYLQALAGIERFEFVATRLELLYNERGTYRVLRFEARPEAGAGAP